MEKKAGRNDPCPCGSGKKYKSCCWGKDFTAPKRKFTAKLIKGGINTQDVLMERTFGAAMQTPFELPKKKNPSESP